MYPFEPSATEAYSSFFTMSTPGEICETLEASFIKNNENKRNDEINYRIYTDKYQVKFEVVTKNKAKVWIKMEIQ